MGGVTVKRELSGSDRGEGVSDAPFPDGKAIGYVTRFGFRLGGDWTGGVGP